MSSKSELIGITEELHSKLHIQARNLLMEYRLSVNDEDLRLRRGYVPCEVVEKLMRLYGGLIAREIWDKMQEREKEFLNALRLAGEALEERDTEAEEHAAKKVRALLSDSDKEIPC